MSKTIEIRGGLAMGDGIIRRSRHDIKIEAHTFAIQANNPAIVSDITMYYGHADIQHDVIA